MFRILKSRLITDVVSFCDCLVTRPVAQGAPLQMDGLNTLLVSAGETASAIDQFLRVFNFDGPLQAARQVRDHMGAHVEIEETTLLPALLHEIDAYDLQECLAFFDRVAKAFEKVCHEVLFLRLYAADGERIYGVTPNSLSVKPFDERDSQPPPDPNVLIADYNSEDVYEEQLAKWLHGDTVSQQDARHYFYQASMHSAPVEQVTAIEDSGSGQRFAGHQLRKVHQFLLNTLQSPHSEHVFTRILELLLACRSGNPYLLAGVDEIVIDLRLLIPRDRQ